MIDADAVIQTQQMVRFFHQEAEEKANEISISAEEEFNIEKLQIVEAEKNQIEEELELKRRNCVPEADIVLWKGKNAMYRPSFSTKDTWNHIRITSNKVAWHKGVWFAHATPKYSFCVWLAVYNRLSTGDHSTACVFCNNTIETRDHLFFSCAFAAGIWEALAKNIFKTRFTTSWNDLITSVSAQWRNRTESFLARYVFQATIHTLWRERNGRRHGDKPNPSTRLIKWIDKQVRNQLSTIQANGDRRYERGLQLWFESRKKKKIRQEYEKKEKQVDVRKKIDYSMQLNASRIKVLQAQDDIVNAMKEEAAKELLKVSQHGFFNHHHHQYKHLLKDLIVQCLLRLKEPAVLLRCRKEDLHMVESMLDDASEEYCKKAKVHAPEIIVDKDIFLPPAPSDGDPHALSCAGGVVLASRDGKIVCENTLDARLEVAFRNKLPEIRKSLFGKVGGA